MDADGWKEWVHYCMTGEHSNVGPSEREKRRLAQKKKDDARRLMDEVARRVYKNPAVACRAMRRHEERNLSAMKPSDAVVDIATRREELERKSVAFTRGVKGERDWLVYCDRIFNGEEEVVSNPTDPRCSANFTMP